MSHINQSTTGGEKQRMHNGLQAPVRLTGGCQCGAVRYVLHAEPEAPCICYCRMCQKQFGNILAAFAGVAIEDFELTRGEIAWFQSSYSARRGFCRDCGTPLAYGYLLQPRIAMALGSLDHPDLVKPKFQYGAEGIVPWLQDALAVPVSATGTAGLQVKANGDDHYERTARTNRQHPDHDTELWPLHHAN
jgi:hypothetical protein